MRQAEHVVRTGTIEMLTEFWWRKPGQLRRYRIRLENDKVCHEEHDVIIWNGFVWLTKGTSGGIFWKWQWHKGSCEM